MPHTKDQYELEVKRLLSSYSYRELQHQFQEWQVSLPEKDSHMLRTENVSGDYITNSKNISYSFDITDCENLKYCTSIKNNSSDLYDIDNFG